LDRPKNFRVWKRAVILALLPVLILIWLIGWMLFNTGSRNTRKTEKPLADTTTSITPGIIVENPEEYAT
jgi:ammonia channel protein AmtB